LEEHLAWAFAATTGVAKENSCRRVDPSTIGSRWTILYGEELQFAAASIP
jgi:hypothetical protein